MSGTRQTYGAGNALAGETVAQILYQAGFRGDALAQMLAIGKRESGYQPSIHGTDSGPSSTTGDFGLFQINGSNVSNLINAGVIRSATDLFDPVTNARAAYFLSGQGTTFSPWNASTGGYNAAGDASFNTDIGAARTVVASAQQKGMLGIPYAGGTMTTPGPTGTSPVGATNGPLKIPSDAQLVNNGQGLFAVFDVGGSHIFYGVNWWDGSVDLAGKQQTKMTPDQWAALGAVDGGNAEELRNIPSAFGSYRQFFDSILQTVIGSNNPAKDDPDVRKIIAEYASRPDMTDAELQGKLQATSWYQTHTTSQLSWNGMSEAEKQKQRDDNGARMADTWFQFTGERVDPNDPRIANYVEDVSSGKIGYGSWTETVVKKQALGNSESPYSRDIRSEQENQKQRGVDVENTAQRVRDLAKRWGVQWSQGTYQDWASRITSKDASEADLITELQTQAQVLYPWKNPTVETQSAAQPWVETYNRVLEKPGDIFDPKVQAALTKGEPVWQFEQELKKSGDWLQTKNARDEMSTAMTSVGKLMGYV